MNPWAAIAQAFVYPVARAWADAWFDAMRVAATYTEESPNATDTDRAARFRASVERLRQRTYDTGSEYTPQNDTPHRGVDSGKTLRRKDAGDASPSP